MIPAGTHRAAGNSCTTLCSLKKESIAQVRIYVVAHAGWDASGANLLGYPAYWVNRQSLPPEEFAPLPEGSGDTLSQLVQFLT
jgi:hypothetical protein